MRAIGPCPGGSVPGNPGVGGPARPVEQIGATGEPAVGTGTLSGGAIEPRQRAVDIAGAFEQRDRFKVERDEPAQSRGDGIEAVHGSVHVGEASGSRLQPCALDGPIGVGRMGQHVIEITERAFPVAGRAASSGPDLVSGDVTGMAREKDLEVDQRRLWLADLDEEARAGEPRGVERRVEREGAVVVGPGTAGRVMRAMKFAALQIERRIPRGRGDGAGDGADLFVEIAVRPRGDGGQQEQGREQERPHRMAILPGHVGEKSGRRQANVS